MDIGQSNPKYSCTLYVLHVNKCRAKMLTNNNKKVKLLVEILLGNPMGLISGLKNGTFLIACFTS